MTSVDDGRPLLPQSAVMTIIDIVLTVGQVIASVMAAVVVLGPALIGLFESMPRRAA